MPRGDTVTMPEVERMIGLKTLMASDSQIAKLTGRDQHTVTTQLARHAGLLQAYRQAKQDRIIDDIDAVRQQYLGHMADPEVLGKASAAQSAVVFGVLSEKLMLELGRPTSINLNVGADLTAPDVLRKLQRALERRGQAPTPAQAKTAQGNE